MRKKWGVIERKGKLEHWGKDRSPLLQNVVKVSPAESHKFQYVRLPTKRYHVHRYLSNENINAEMKYIRLLRM